MQVCTNRACNSFAAQGFGCCQSCILSVHAESLGGTAVHIQHFDIRIICSRQDDGCGTDRIQHLHITGSQSLCLICTGGDLRIFHCNIHICKCVCKDAFFLFNDGRHIQGGCYIGKCQFIQRFLRGSAACECCRSHQSCHCYADKSFFHVYFLLNHFIFIVSLPLQE